MSRFEYYTILPYQYIPIYNKTLTPEKFYNIAKTYICLF